MLLVCYIVGGMICWVMFFYFGRVIIYMFGFVFMFCCLIVIGVFGFYCLVSIDFVVGIIFVILMFCNMIMIGFVCYFIVVEILFGKFRYKIIFIGRIVYNFMGIVNNILMFCMVLENGKLVFLIYSC